MQAGLLRFLLPVLCLLLAASATAAGAEDASLLPEELVGWRRTQWVQVAAVDLEQLVGDQAPLLREYGAQRGEQATYRYRKAACRLTLLEMQDHSSAYGAFTLLRAGAQPIAVGEAGAHGMKSLIFYQGNYFVMAGGSIDLVQLNSLASRLESQTTTQPSLPNLPAFLPRQGFVAGSDRYVLGPLALAQVAPLAAGDWVGFAYGAELEAARYRVGSELATLLLISYPTPQIASARLEDFGRLFNLDGAGDPQRRAAYSKRRGTLVVLVAGLSSKQAATGLLDEVAYDVEVSWSDPLPTRSHSDWARTLVDLFIGTGLFLLVAMGFGLAFALVRLAVTRFLPGKVFDRTDESEVVFLNLQDKQ